MQTLTNTCSCSRSGLKLELAFVVLSFFCLPTNTSKCKGTHVHTYTNVLYILLAKFKSTFCGGSKGTTIVIMRSHARNVFTEFMVWGWLFSWLICMNMFVGFPMHLMPG